MNREDDAVTARLWFALAVATGGLITLLVPALPTAGDSAGVLVAALVTALLAAVLVGGATPGVAHGSGSSPGRLRVAVATVDARGADPTTHPRRPRAPGMA